jgi:profilin
MSAQEPKDKWQRYIDDALLKTDQVSSAAIYGLDGTKWATSENFNVSSDQITKLVSCITDDPMPLKKLGIKVANQSYIFLRHEPGRSIYGRRGADSGICIVKTRKSLLVGVYGPGIQPGNCNLVMEKMADYLIEYGL